MKTLRAALLCLTLLPLAAFSTGCNGGGGDDDDDGATPLDAPTNLAVTNGDGHYEITWDLVPDAVGYRVFEADTVGADPATLTPIEVVAPPFARTGIANWITKYYRVQAVGVDRPVSALSADIGAAGSAGWLIASRKNAVGVPLAVRRHHADELNAAVDEIAGAEFIVGGALPAAAGTEQGVGVAAVLYGIGPSTGYSEIGLFRSSARVTLAAEAGQAYLFAGYQDVAAPRVLLQDIAGGTTSIVSLSALGGDARVLKAGCISVNFVKSGPAGIAFACDEGTAFDYWVSNGLDAAVKIPGGGTSTRTLTHMVGSRGFFFQTTGSNLTSQLLDGLAGEVALPTDGNNDETLVTHNGGPNDGKPIVGAGGRIFVRNFAGASAYDLHTMDMDGGSPATILINGTFPDVKSLSPDGTRFTVVRGTSAFTYTVDSTATQAVLHGTETATDARFLEDGNILVFKGISGPTVVTTAGTIVTSLGLSPNFVWSSNKAGFAVLHYPAVGDLTAVRLSDTVPFALSNSTLSPAARQFADDGYVVFVDDAGLPWIANPDVSVLKQTIDTTPSTKVTPIGFGEGNRVFLQLTRDVSPYYPSDLVMFDLDTESTTPLVTGATDDIGWFFPN